MSTNAECLFQKIQMELLIPVRLCATKGNDCGNKMCCWINMGPIHPAPMKFNQTSCTKQMPSGNITSVNTLSNSTWLFMDEHCNFTGFIVVIVNCCGERIQEGIQGRECSCIKMSSHSCWMISVWWWRALTDQFVCACVYGRCLYVCAHVCAFQTRSKNLWNVYCSFSRLGFIVYAPMRSISVNKPHSQSGDHVMTLRIDSTPSTEWKVIFWQYTWHWRNLNISQERGHLLHSQA